MLTAWEVYWITRLDSISSGLAVLCAMSILCCAAVWVLHFMFDESMPDPMKALIRHAKGLTALAVLFSLLAGLCPTSRECAAIVFIPRVLNNEELSDEATELYVLAKRWLAEGASKQ